VLAASASDYYTRIERATSAVSPTESSRRWFGRYASARPSVPTSSTLARAAGANERRRRPTKQQVRRASSGIIDAIAAPRLSPQRSPANILATNGSERALYSPLFEDPVRPVNPARFVPDRGAAAASAPRPLVPDRSAASPAPIWAMIAPPPLWPEICGAILERTSADAVSQWSDRAAVRKGRYATEKEQRRCLTEDRRGGSGPARGEANASTRRRSGGRRRSRCGEAGAHAGIAAAKTPGTLVAWPRTVVGLGPLEAEGVEQARFGAAEADREGRGTMSGGEGELGAGDRLALGRVVDAHRLNAGDATASPLSPTTATAERRPPPSSSA